MTENNIGGDSPSSNRRIMRMTSEETASYKERKRQREIEAAEGEAGREAGRETDRGADRESDRGYDA
ncbi:MAG: hypothetical protein K2Z81_26390, partial [Cyanobacteria bacterium]|nr:hypothetical protein [Cyanobacteriota bacterium]